jgi:hypothetical protein
MVFIHIKQPNPHRINSHVCERKKKKSFEIPFFPSLFSWLFPYPSGKEESRRI